MLYVISDGEYRENIEAESLDDARKQAEEWVEGGDWNIDELEETFWVQVSIAEEYGNIVDEFKVAIDPVMPECNHLSSKHNWQSPIDLVGGCEENPGVFGHGGGVFITEVCLRCGCERTIDTWAQDRTDGEQGLRSVSYERGKYEEEIE
jgi:hypothetical protein